jgi:hypothetical protein
MLTGNRKAVLIALAGLVLLLLIAPAVSASAGTPVIPVANINLVDNSANLTPDLLPSLKLHAAFLGQDQEARMDGVIAYIGNISGGTGITGLQQIEDDYLTIAASIPLMTTDDQIAGARDAMKAQTQLFSDETNAQLVMFNGSVDNMRASIASSQQAADASFRSINASLWLARDSARLTLFDADSEQRAFLLRNLDKQGIDTALARNISDRIDAQRPGIQDALINNSADALLAANTNIRSLTREFRTTVADSQVAMAIELKREALMAMPG